MQTPSPLDPWLDRNSQVEQPEQSAPERRTQRIGYVLLILALLTGAVVLFFASQTIP